MAMATKAKAGKLLIERGSGNVFADIGFDRAEAANLRLRSELMMRVERYVRESGATQTEAARVLGITQPRLNALLKGRIDLFSLDALVNMLTRAGIGVELRLRKAA
ncbi:MAG: transcriptional regulator [Betaproteobacteria bacterium]|jgi:predicted XRE-type DNA-binding protein|nr:MAG: transcriptional regulator [Betaproteobacteria bacterium]